MAAPTSVMLSNEVLGVEFVTLNVGESQTKFTVHKKLLCDSSDFFSKAFKGPWNEGQTSAMDLPEDNENSIGAFITWLYRGKLPDYVQLANALDDEAKPQSPSSRRDALHRLGELMDSHITAIIRFAERICNDLLMNQIMDAVQDLFTSKNIVFEGVNIRDIYRCTSAKSKARLLCAASFTYYVKVSDHGKLDVARSLNKFVDMSVENTDIFKDLLKFQSSYWRSIYVDDLEFRSRDPAKGYGPCFFHTHTEGAICHLTQSAS